MIRCSVGFGSAKFDWRVSLGFVGGEESLRGDDLTQRRAGAADGDRRA